MGAGMQARVESIHLNVEHRQLMRPVESAQFMAGFGIEDDRHATPRSDRQGYHVLLVDKETLDSSGLSPGEIKENITTVGIDINALQAGQLITIGNEVIVEVFKPCSPCSRLDEIRPGLQEELEGRRGMLAKIVHSGTVKTGDPVNLTSPKTNA